MSLRAMPTGYYCAEERGRYQLPGCPLRELRVWPGTSGSRSLDPQLLSYMHGHHGIFLPTSLTRGRPIHHAPWHCYEQPFTRVSDGSRRSFMGVG